MFSAFATAKDTTLDAPNEILQLEELRPLSAIKPRNQETYNPKELYKTARNNLTVAAQQSEYEVAYDMTISYQEGYIYNPASGKMDKVYLRAYNDKFIAPAVIMKPGQTVRFNLKNKLPVPTVDCSRADMNTPAPPTCFNDTNLHSHGLWISPTGNSDNVLLSISPGVAFEYEYNIPADHPAGTFWYHPHTHGSTAIQVASGMSGALIVKGERKPTDTSNGDIDTLLEPLTKTAGIEDEIKLLQQIPYACFDKNKAIKKDSNKNWICEEGDVGTVENFNLQVGNPSAWGESGRYTLINGQARPRINAKPAQLYRWRLIDAGFNETVNLRIREVKRTKNTKDIAVDSIKNANIEKTCDGQDITQYEIASDGLTHKNIIAKKTNVLQPGYRSDILFSLPKKGIYCVYDDTSKADATVSATNENPRVLAIIVAKGNGTVKDQRAFLQDSLISLAEQQFSGSIQKVIIDDLKKFELSKFVPHQDITSEEIIASKQNPIYIDFNLVIPPKNNPNNIPVQFLINNSAFQMGRIDQTLNLGAAQTWFLSSKSVNHPFHIHVNPFQIVSITDKKTQKPSTEPQYQNLIGTWKDTLFVNTDVVIETRTRYERYIGEYVLHCHILEHEDQGMMQSVKVVLPSSPNDSHHNH